MRRPIRPLLQGNAGAILSVISGAVLLVMAPRARALVQTARLSEQRRRQLESANAELAAQGRRLTAANAELARLYAESQQARDLLQAELDNRSHDVITLAGEVAVRYRELQVVLATLRENETALRQSVKTAEEATRLRDDFLSVAAHELRTPITVLRGQADLNLRQLRKGGPLDPARLDHALEVMNAHALKLARLVDQLLDVSRIQGGRLILDRQPTNVTRLVGEIVAARQPSLERHSLTFVPAADTDITATVDPLRVEQVVNNLIDNAIKYSPTGGPVRVDLAQPSAEAVEIAVTDQGIGIPPSQRGAIFDRFYRAHAAAYYSGLGLGLHISREIVELHSGSIRAEFPPEGGSRFIVRLPLIPPDPTPTIELVVPAAGITEDSPAG
jgi:signal transduction histidine kinase